MIAVLPLMFASCMHPQIEEKTESVTVSVQKDLHTKKVPTSFTLEKGSELGFTQLMHIMSSLEFEAGYELDKITINAFNGIEITDNEPHIFDENTTIYVCSQTKKEVPALTRLKIEHIARNMDISFNL